MITTKSYSIRRVMQFSGHHFSWLVPWMFVPVLLHEYANFQWFYIPWLPISLIGTAVAFYVGFKNNSSYDRMWESRKIWGAIINTSRSWGMYIKSFVTNQFTDQKLSDHDLKQIQKKLIYRHIGWLYALRSQLLVPTEWEHISQKGMVGTYAAFYRKRFGVGLIDDDVTKNELKEYLPSDEYERLINYKNTATQIIDQQAQDLKQLREQDLIEDFRHMELQRILMEFYDHQGKCERIKKFPMPRQYANMSFIFIAIFIFLLPFGMVSEFSKLGQWGIWMSIPFNVIVGWIFVMMEIVGDYSENPFEGLQNDIPMLSICRTIEIDLKEMLGEENIPPAIQSKNGILM
ncbi:bestrophin family protein [Marinoscillum pacificum]|uniref:bestrophin family protein n=1 Tax=Marinoscillum pacificum TaxID=392723 RepID=UPI002157F0CE|nr:bestrophin family ion channel [Marinoscillum pacificum]